MGGEIWVENLGKLVSRVWSLIDFRVELDSSISWNENKSLSKVTGCRNRITNQTKLRTTWKAFGSNLQSGDS